MADEHELDVPNASELGELIDPNAPGVTDRAKVQRKIKELKEIESIYIYLEEKYSQIMTFHYLNHYQNCCQFYRS